MNILYEDNHLLAVEKPENIPVQADASGDADLLTLAKAYIKEKYHKPGDVYLGLVHRLDRPVGGVLVFARTSKAAARLTDQFRARKAEKRYVAVVEGSAPAERQLTDWLLKDERTNTVSVVPPHTPGAKEARLRFRTLAREKGLSLLDITLDTGRPHQIRVQLKNAGLPILNDQRYNPSARPGAQIRLWAYSLSLQHPTLGETMTFFSRPLWGEFATALKYLSAYEAGTVLYEDEEKLVVDKNAGTEVETDLTEALNAVTEGVLPVHRLDANTMGLVLFSKTEAANERLVGAFERHEVKKIYEAVLAGIPKKEKDTLVNWAEKNAESATVKLCREGERGAMRMELDYETVEKRAPLSRVRIVLKTGKTHQIRVQTAAIGCPVLGDDKYGDREMNKAYKQRGQLLVSKELTVEGQTFTSPRTLSLKELV